MYSEISPLPISHIRAKKTINWKMILGVGVGMVVILGVGIGAGVVLESKFSAVGFEPGTLLIWYNMAYGFKKED